MPRPVHLGSNPRTSDWPRSGRMDWPTQSNQRHSNRFRSSRQTITWLLSFCELESAADGQTSVGRRQELLGSRAISVCSEWLLDSQKPLASEETAECKTLLAVSQDSKAGDGRGHVQGQFRAARCHVGSFDCGQTNILTAFKDVGPGDGTTVIIPGSQKSNIMRLEFDASKMWTVATSVDSVTAAVEVHLKAGNALLFIDAIMHGSAARINLGQRRMAVYRYGSS